MLLTLLTAASLLQISVSIDTTRSTGDPRRDSIRAERMRARRVPVTEAHLASAFRDPQARTLLERARAARVRQDSSITGYEATSYTRMSAGVGLGGSGLQRLLFRTESSARVRWHRDVGATLEVTGLRTALLGLPPDAQREVERNMHGEASGMSGIPYYPGRETLMIGGGVAQAEVNDREIVHPLATGSEAYYQYESGDETGFTLPDGRRITLRELRIRPRRAEWNLVVGTVWLDTESGQVVRAAWRSAAPNDLLERIRELDPDELKEMGIVGRAFASTVRTQLNSIAIEYGLHQGRFWLPRIAVAEGVTRVGFARFPMRMQQSFTYTGVNADWVRDSMPATIVVAPTQEELDRRVLDSIPKGQHKAWRDSVEKARERANGLRADSVARGLAHQLRGCDTSGVHIAATKRGTGTVPVLMRTPCDRVALTRSADLPASLFDEGELAADAATLESLVRGALTLGAQAGLGASPPRVRSGLEFVRFNRVEGLSLGAGVAQQLGGGYVADAALRIGLADREPNGELGLARTNLTRTVRIGAYNRLVPVGDWGRPLSFGSSVGALLWGRDEGFYHRASGLELTSRDEDGLGFAWRLFAEQQREATAENAFSLAKLVRDRRFAPNIVAQRGVWSGLGLRDVRSAGVDPRGWRAASDLRAEAAGGESAYGRLAADLTLSRALGPAASNAPLAALTLAGGTTLGDAPVQRFWYLGGTHTVRGQAPGAAAGNAFWLTRAELAQETRIGRVALFGDVGWAGSRSAWGEVGRPLSGAGAGYSLLDGLVRFDVARGIHPSRTWRLDLYLGGRF